MITLTFENAIALYISIFIIGVFTLWFLFSRKEQDTLTQSDHFQKCPFCAFIFFKYDNDEIGTCPRCKSLIHKE